MLLMRTVRLDGSSSHGFVWPLEIGAITRCPDPDPDPDRDCGGGLHGLPFGEGCGALLDWSADAVGLVFEARDDEVIVSQDKARAIGEVSVRFVGLISKCADYLVAKGYGDKSIVGRCVSSTGYDSQSASSGYRSRSASSGDRSQSASSGEDSQSASSGDHSRSASSGYRSQSASSGDDSQSASSGAHSRSASSGDHSRSASSGYRSQSASSGDHSRSASSGDHSRSASSGYRSQSASTGKHSIAMVAGLGGRAAAGPGGAFALPWLDGQQVRIAVGIVGENAKPDTWYGVSAGGSLVEGEPVDGEITNRCQDGS